jgi:hypothetical protein
MTDHTHSTAIKVDVYPDEFRPIMKALRFALSSNEFTEYVLDNDKTQVELLEFFLDDFTTVALNEAV